MLPKSFLTQLIPARIAEALRRVEAQVWGDAGEVLEVETTESHARHRAFSELSASEFGKVPAGGFCWGPKYSQRWFRVRLSKETSGGRRFFEWRDQAEATLYLNGEPYAGLDLAHPQCLLPSDVRELYVEAVCIRTGIWLDGKAAPLNAEGSRYEAPVLRSRNEIAWAVYHDLRVLLDVLEVEYGDAQPGSKKAFTDPIRFSPPAWRATPLFRRWCARLDGAIDVFDREGLAAFGAELRRLYSDFPADGQALRAILTGHAHIDLVWLWPEEVGAFKTIHTWSSQVRLLETYPEFRFGFSQPAAYEAVEKRAPGLHARVKQFVASGRWEATGGSYVECDTQLPCGEALLRCLRLGQERFKDLRGRPASVFWLPDVFGYSSSVPQLLRAFGITGFFTSKLSWSTINRFPHTSFRWRGADGSEVLSHVVLLHDYNEAVNVRSLREDALHHQQAAVHPEFLVPTGYGDGGGGPTEEMCERARRLADLSGAPKTEWGGIEPFFERLRAVEPDLPVVSGELMLELHRGTFTTHGELKASFRALERALFAREAVELALGGGPVEPEAWRRLIFAQFHDYIPGSSIWEVYAAGVPELKKLAEAVRAASVKRLPSVGGEAALFNPCALRRTWLADGICYELPPLSGRPLSALAQSAAREPEIAADALTNGAVRARFGAKGLASLEIDGALLALDDGALSLCAYPDHPAQFEAWDIDRSALASGREARLVSGPVFEMSPACVSVTYEYAVGAKSRASVVYSLRKGETALRVSYDVDWRDEATLLKAVVRTGYRGRMARFGSPFGSVLRGQQPGFEREEAQWELSASRWMVLLDDAQGEGLALVTEAKYGFSVRDGVAGVSLLRSALVTEADAHPSIRTSPDRPRYSDLGRHRVELAFARYAPSLPRERQPAALADLLYTPCFEYKGGSLGCGLVALEGAPSLVPAWSEPLEKGAWALRLHETLGCRGRVAIRVEKGWRASACALARGAGEPWPEGSADELALVFGPYQIITVLFFREGGS